MRFIKMHGLGNDFVILDFRDGQSAPTPAKIASIADRKTGIGFDQLILLLPRQNPESALFMQIYNQDGSEAEACGNATRCVAALIMDEIKKDMVLIETIVGLLPCWREPDGRITIDMGEPKFGWQDIPLSKEYDTMSLNFPFIWGDIQGTLVNMGNPHCVFFESNVEGFPVASVGAQIEKDKVFPEGTNVEFVTVLSRTKIRQRTWERGAGETRACGSGACAVLVAAVRRDLADRKADIVLDGGTLTVEWRESDNHVFMTGAAAHVFDGTLKDL